MGKKLFTLIGNADVDSRYIKNTYSENIVIEPNSQIELAGLTVAFKDVPSGGQFIITPGSTITVDTKVNTLTPATYTADELGDEVELQMSVNGVSVTEDSAFIEVSYDDATEKYTFTQTAYDAAVVDFTTDYVVQGGFTGDSTGTLTCTGDGSALSNHYVPSNKFSCTGTISALPDAGGNLRVGLYDNIGDIHTGIIIGDAYDAMFNNNSANFIPSTAPATGDEFSISRDGNEIAMHITRSASIICSAGPFTVTEDYCAKYLVGNNRSSFALDSGSTSNGQITGYTTTEVQTAATTLTISAISTTTLENYLGFSGATFPQTDTDDPAAVSSTTEVSGFTAFSFAVLIEPFILDSYVGVSSSRNSGILERNKISPKNVLYMCHDITNLVQGKQIADRYSLNIRNIGKTNVSQLIVSFIDLATNNIIEFTGNPLISLLIS